MSDQHTDRFTFDEPMPADGATLADEPLTQKGMRMLRFAREFVASEHGVTAMQVDGQVVFLIKHTPDRMPADADTTTDLAL